MVDLLNTACEEHERVPSESSSRRVMPTEASSLAGPGSPITLGKLSGPGLAGHGLNMLAREVDAANRLLNLVPAPTLLHHCFDDERWIPAYALSPATSIWTHRVRSASVQMPARVVGVVGATSAGKSWLISKLQEEVGPRPVRLEEQFDGMTLQSMTSDINMYTDLDGSLYYIDFEGTYGTLPLLTDKEEHQEVMGRCPNARAWEAKRRQSLKEYYQPVIAYLTCNVVIFVTREKLVCRRSLDECEQFVQAANARVVSSLTPALILVQNCCRPTEGIFDGAKCTEAFMHTHFGDNLSYFQKFFRSIDCFCVPDEFLVCKRTGFDGEDVSKKVIESMKQTIRMRIAEDLAVRQQNQVLLSQVQWYTVLSALCRIVNDRETVHMTTLCARASESCQGIGELKAALLRLMSEEQGSRDAKLRMKAAFGIAARFIVRRELPKEDVTEIAHYLLSLFPCGGIASGGVKRFDGNDGPVCCGRMRLMHESLHRSAVLVKTADAGWLQGVSEWFRGGIIHAWSGSFECHPDFTDINTLAGTRNAIEQEIEVYKVEKCLEGLSPEVGGPWAKLAFQSLHATGMDVRKDMSRMCLVCTAAGVEAGYLAWFWPPPQGNHLPVCELCYGTLERLDLVGPDAGVIALENPTSSEQHCEACINRWDTSRRVGQRPRNTADHRLLPCKCPVCASCAVRVAAARHPICPLCDKRFRWSVDERALLRTGWPQSTRPRAKRDCARGCGCTSSRK
mmetsp:Transcript_54259/g.129332  ORF Transcript_54259/g.129332 Transcript_54259/m.129332 type:complete len:736 (-) Transcript_54259:113-2320(-)